MLLQKSKHNNWCILQVYKVKKPKVQNDFLLLNCLQKKVRLLQLLYISRYVTLTLKKYDICRHGLHHHVPVKPCKANASQVIEKVILKKFQFSKQKYVLKLGLWPEIYKQECIRVRACVCVYAIAIYPICFKLRNRADKREQSVSNVRSVFINLKRVFFITLIGLDTFLLFPN